MKVKVNPWLTYTSSSGFRSNTLEEELNIILSVYNTDLSPDDKAAITKIINKNVVKNI